MSASRTCPVCGRRARTIERGFVSGEAALRGDDAGRARIVAYACAVGHRWDRDRTPLDPRRRGPAPARRLDGPAARRAEPL